MAKAEISVKVLDLPEVKAYIEQVNAEVERMRAVLSAVASWYPDHKRAKDCHAEGLLCPQTRAIVEAYEQWKDKAAE